MHLCSDDPLPNSTADMYEYRMSIVKGLYCIMGNFGEVLCLAIWVKDRQFKYACTPMSIQIAKFKFHQNQLRDVSPNLMLVQVTCYTVCPR